MSKIKIRTRNDEYIAELDDSDISNTIWLSLPFTAQINMLGSQIYFEMPVNAKMDGERVTKLEIGDIAYWPKVEAFCIFFGPTPLSDDDDLPVSKFPVIKIGKLIDNCASMEDAGDRQNIVLEKLL
ncbi:MAG: cyclophilin-like fold protein [Candidatus Methanomethylophilaceae archaeon]|nr:cyclophilin-like fold protein [Candidatus Methanomethylophilaceae archaeon]MDY0224210.1 cyclophilin-like fold protein [Candidatus Methanomethylophilaceae archaeon]